MSMSVNGRPNSPSSTEGRRFSKRTRLSGQFCTDFLAKYGLEIIGCHPVTNVVDRVSCRFCTLFGNNDKKRERSGTKLFTPPYRAEVFENHLRQCHPLRYRYYSTLPPKEKGDYFALETSTTAGSTSLSTSTISPNSNFEQPILERTSIFHVNKSIVEEILPEIISVNTDFTPAENFQLTAEDLNSESYSVFVSNPSQFFLFVKQIAVGWLIESPLSESRPHDEEVEGEREKEELINSNGGYGNEMRMRKTRAKMETIGRIVCALNFQKLAQLMASKAVLFLAFVIRPVRSDNDLVYFTVRVRVCVDLSVREFHLLAVPTSEQDHNQTRTMLTLLKILDALYKDWRTKTLGVVVESVGGASTTPKDFVELLQRHCGSGCVRVWSATEQLDVVVQRAVGRAIDGTFLTVLVNLLSFLRRQKSRLGGTITTVCPMFSGTRWSEMRGGLNWLYVHCTAVRTYLRENVPNAMPDEAWWGLAMALARFMMEVNYFFDLMETTLHQNEALSELLTTLFRFSKAQGPVETDDCAKALELDRVVYGKFTACPAYTRTSFFDSCGVTLHDIIDVLPERERKQLLCKVAKMMAEVASGVYDSWIEIGGKEEVNTKLLPCSSPHQLVHLSSVELFVLMRSYAPNLRISLSTEELEAIERDHAKLQLAYHREPVLRDAIDACSYSTNIREGWFVTLDRFPALCHFAKGLAITVPGAVDGATPLTDPLLTEKLRKQTSSLEVRIQATQFEDLQAVFKE